MNQLASTAMHSAPAEKAASVVLPSEVKVVPVALNPAALDATRAKLKTNYKNGKKKKKNNRNTRMDRHWAEVYEMRQSCRDLLRASLAITPLLRHKPLLGKVVNRNLLSRTITSITDDTTVLSKELSIIGQYVDARRKQCGSEGAAITAAQTAFQHYVNFMERYDSALLPLIEHASEQLTEALIAYEKTSPVEANTLQRQMNAILTNIGYIVRDTIGINEKKD